MLVSPISRLLYVAVVTNNIVSNIIVIDKTNMNTFIESGMELVETEPYGLVIGDYREGENWYRYIDEVKTQLPLPTPEDKSADMLEALETLGYTEV